MAEEDDPRKRTPDPKDAATPDPEKGGSPPAGKPPALRPAAGSGATLETVKEMGADTGAPAQKPAATVAPAAIISMAQQARPKPIGQSADLRAQLST